MGYTLTKLRETGLVADSIIYRLDGPGVCYPVTMFNSSTINLVSGLFRRVLTYKGGAIHPPEKDQWRRLTRQVLPALKSVGLFPTTPMSPDEYLKCFGGRKLAIYSKAFESLAVQPIGPSDFTVRAFVKKEKDKDGQTDPRIIQPRSPRFHVSFGRYVRAMEGFVYKRWSKLWRKSFGTSNTPVIFKGLNYLERGNFFAEKWATFNRPVAVALDASRFDLHVSCDALQFTDDLYRACFERRYHAELDYLLGGRHETSGVALCRESVWGYSKKGGRCSGDADTSLGNVSIMLAISWCIANKISTRLELANDGDDQVFIIESNHLDELLSVVEPCFARYGFRVKIEEPVYELEQIDFCQTRPVLMPSGVVMTRYPSLSMTKDLCTFLQAENLKIRKEILSAVSSCGLAAYRDMPILGWFYWRMNQCVKDIPTDKHWRRTGIDQGFLYHTMRLSCDVDRPPRVEPESRVSFFMAFGIPPEAQVTYEEEIQSWTPNLSVGPAARVEQFSHWWISLGATCP
nr:MAG: RNA-dependent RNA polymerase [Plant tombusvirus-like associated RNA 1]